jgi:hypothetical protein
VPLLELGSLKRIERLVEIIAMAEQEPAAAVLAEPFEDVVVGGARCSLMRRCSQWS